MQQLVVSIHPDLVEPASTRFLEGTLDETSYRVGGMDLETPDGIQYQLQLTNTGEGIVLSGEASCTAITPCTRCLVPTRIEVSGAVEGYYLLEASEDVDGYEDDEFRGHRCRWQLRYCASHHRRPRLCDAVRGSLQGRLRGLVPALRSRSQRGALRLQPRR